MIRGTKKDTFLTPTRKEFTLSLQLDALFFLKPTRTFDFDLSIWVLEYKAPFPSIRKDSCAFFLPQNPSNICHSALKSRAFLWQSREYCFDPRNEPTSLFGHNGKLWGFVMRPRPSFLFFGAVDHKMHQGAILTLWSSSAQALRGQIMWTFCVILIPFFVLLRNRGTVLGSSFGYLSRTSPNHDLRYFRFPLNVLISKSEIVFISPDFKAHDSLECCICYTTDKNTPHCCKSLGPRRDRKSVV